MEDTLLQRLQDDLAPPCSWIMPRFSPLPPSYSSCRFLDNSATFPAVNSIHRLGAEWRHFPHHSEVFLSINRQSHWLCSAGSS